MIPSGLIDNNIEFFAHNNALYSLQNGQRSKFPEMPEDHIVFLQTQFGEDPHGRATVQHLPIADQLRIYSICRFGGCNDIPDNTEGECTDDNEYYNCGFRGSCRHEGIRCKEVLAENGVISPRQLEVMKMVANGLLNKEIADRLKISENTVANHLAHIFDKIGNRSRVSITAFINERGIL